ncbi:Hypothetical protein PP7435_CHR1-1575 [Komagataella phaffii CBS 7435]|uniref:Uncharacterized protein n=1 Tax=Komagataella phaffii (strain ATCC 76273 / CBS 7435 / CECT 11047 / NRRL Y-11430 / Wegner 21-1) TaxID=981350 RepID=F2QQK7_KOMPC|nr:Hypothetical protein BQ9382_C1-8218 [Komagataella phaffii CBS 7435]CCA37685.1 Hypothetical protein PP7435_CHR1-1575 [Komagataella phaffii CBS 7435]
MVAAVPNKALASRSFKCSYAANNLFYIAGDGCIREIQWVSFRVSTEEVWLIVWSRNSRISDIEARSDPALCHPKSDLVQLEIGVAPVNTTSLKLYWPLLGKERRFLRGSTEARLAIDTSSLV